MKIALAIQITISLVTIGTLLFSGVQCKLSANTKKQKTIKVISAHKGALYKDGVFYNTQETHLGANNTWETLKEFISKFNIGTPKQAIKTTALATANFSNNETIKYSWLGHSTALLDIEGYTIITDPVFDDRVSPVPGLGPTHFDYTTRPTIDAVLISHDHYDHLSKDSI